MIWRLARPFRGLVAGLLLWLAAIWLAGFGTGVGELTLLVVATVVVVVVAARPPAKS